MADGNYAGMSFDKVLKVDLLGSLCKLGASLVTVLSFDLLKLALKNALKLLLALKNRTKLCDKHLKLCNSVLNLLPFKPGKLTESHLYDSLCLNVGKTESVAKLKLCIGNRSRALDDLNNLVDILCRYSVALKNMDLTKCFFKIKLCTSFDNFLLEIYVFVKYSWQIKRFRLATVDNEHINRAGILKLCILVKLIENDLSICIASILDNNSHTASAGLITQCCDSLNLLFLNKISHTLYKHRLVNHIGYLGEDDPSVLILNNSSCSYINLASSGLVCFSDTARAVNYGSGGKVGTLDKHHKVADRAFGIVNSVNDTVNNLGEIMGRNVSCHTNRNTNRAIDKQIGKP